MQPLRVLFIGNSHTHVNDVPGSVQKLLAWGTGAPVVCDRCSTDSVGWEWHYGQPASRARLDQGRFDFVVLQERSGAALEAPASTRRYGGAWVDLVKAHGATPVIYMTWALAHDVASQPRIDAVYEDAASRHGARLAPVGRAFAEAGRCFPGLPLYDTDGRHAAPAGSFLAACVLAQTLAPDCAFGGLPGPVPGPSSLSPDDRARLLALASRTVAGVVAVGPPGQI